MDVKFPLDNYLKMLSANGDADKAVPVENSLQFAAALRRAGGLPSLHVYEKGSHGLGLGRPEKPAPPWSEQLLYWFKERKFTP